MFAFILQGQLVIKLFSHYLDQANVSLDHNSAGSFHSYISSSNGIMIQSNTLYTLQYCFDLYHMLNFCVILALLPFEVIHKKQHCNPNIQQC